MPLKEVKAVIPLLMLLLLVTACGRGEPSVAPERVPVATTNIAPVQPGPSEITVPVVPPEQTPGILSPGSSEISPLPVPEISGLRVVYTKEGDLWLWENGVNTRLTESGGAYQPKISADGEVIAFLRPADNFHIELWAVNTDGAEERRLVSISDFDTIGGGVRDPNAVAINPYHYEWVPGTHTLAFNTFQSFQGPGVSPLDDLNLVNADTNQLTFLLLSGWGGEFTYSPDGSKIAITQPDSIILAEANGSNYREVHTYEPVLTYSEYRFYAQPHWESNGRFIRVAIPPVEALAQPVRPTILWTIKVEGSTIEKDGEVFAVPFFEQEVAYTPDLERLIYLREVGQPAENLRELVIANYDGMGEWVYQRGALISFVSWSLDSQRFAFRVGEDQEMMLGAVNEPAVTFSSDPFGIIDVRWVDEIRYVYHQQKADGYFDLILASIHGESILLDMIPEDPPEYDFSIR